jgi:glycosyltransferase involved in cell wall biosynthesis
LHSIVPNDDPRLQFLSLRIDAGVISRNLWHYVTLPSLVAQLEPDIIHFAYPVPVNIRAFNCPTVVTLHDLYPYDIPRNFGFPKVVFNRLILNQCLRTVDAIACVSDSTLHRLDAFAPRLALQKASTIYNCVEPASSIAEDGPIAKWNGEPFFLLVAQHRRNKNILLTLRIFERLLRDKSIAPETRLVIIGIEGPETASINAFLSEANLTRKVVLLHGVSDAQLQWCYQRCELLLAPSIVEGFGLPIAEALFHGCRIVCSDIAAFRELGGEHCRYVPLGPSVEEDFAKAIREVRCNPRKAPVALPQLSAPVIAEQYLQLYQRLLASYSFSAKTSSQEAQQKGGLHEHV